MTVNEVGQAIGNMDISWIAYGVVAYVIVAVVIYAICQADSRPRPYRQPEPTPDELARRAREREREAARWEKIRNYRSPAGYQNGVKLD